MGEMTRHPPMDSIRIEPSVRIESKYLEPILYTHVIMTRTALANTKARHRPSASAN